MIINDQKHCNAPHCVNIVNMLSGRLLMDCIIYHCQINFSHKSSANRPNTESEGRMSP